MIRRCLLLMAAVIGAGECASVVRVHENYQFTAEWADYENLVVRSGNGSICVTADPTAKGAEISGRKYAGGLTLAEARANLEKLEIVTRPDPSDPRTLRIETHFPKALRHRPHGASLYVRVPQRCAVEAFTSNGSIRIKGLGPVVADTSNGSVRVRDVTGSVRVSTSNGSVVLKNVAGDCSVRTSNGSVRTVDLRGNLEVTTSNGRIEAEAIPPDDGRVILRTSNGSVTATLPATLAGLLRASTSNGRVQLDSGSASAGDLRTSRSSLRAALNGGGPATVTIATSNGPVAIELS